MNCYPKTMKKLPNVRADIFKLCLHKQSVCKIQKVILFANANILRKVEVPTEFWANAKFPKIFAQIVRKCLRTVL